MKTADFDYSLPRELIAQAPPAQRTDARMLVVDRAADRIVHARFTDLPRWTRPGDALVLNDTRVIPARLNATRESTGGGVEFLFLEPVGEDVWTALVRSNRRPSPDTVFLLGSGRARAIVEETGERGWCRVRIAADRPLTEILHQEGRPPLPPYIRRRPDDPVANVDRDRYQTVFAREDGAVAAPTAGLHFTPEILRRLNNQGVPHGFVTLHVGIGTFRPVQAEEVEQHQMDDERYEVPSDTADLVNRTRDAGGRVIAVGSTCVRTLETVAGETGRVGPGRGRTSLFIRPPYTFRAVDAMLTNFHLPCSTLLMMVCAFGGTERILRAYREAVRARYRFYSYGDCMLVV